MAFRHIEVEAATPTVGAYVSGVDLNQVSSKTIYAEIKLALWKHGVLFFRAQKLKPEAYLRLGQVFGDMEKHEFFPHLPDHPQIQLISHEGIDNPETDRWHTDVTFRKKPNLVSMLRITDLPTAGGDTMWASAAAAFDALGTELQTLLMGLQAEHDLPFHFRRINAAYRLIERQHLAEVKKGGKKAAKQNMNSQALKDAVITRETKLLQDNPSVVHPAVITHPFNHRNLLFVNSIWTKRFLGLHLDLSEALLRMLFEWIKKPEFMVRFKWEPDSLVIWDNCQTQHYAVFDYAPQYRAGERLTCGTFVPRLKAGRTELGNRRRGAEA